MHRWRARSGQLAGISLVGDDGAGDGWDVRIQSYGRVEC